MDEGGIAFAAGGNLNQRDADLGWKEFFMIGPLVGMAAAAILDDQILPLDSFGPEDRIVLPKRGRRDIALIHTLISIKRRARAAAYRSVSNLGLAISQAKSQADTVRSRPS